MSSDQLIELVRSANPVTSARLDAASAERATIILDRLRTTSVPEPVAPPRGADALRRARPIRSGGSHRARTLALATVLAAAAVGAASAFGAVGRLLDLFEGTPGTPQIQESFNRWNGGADTLKASAAKQGFVATLPHADPASAHGVLQLQTSDGPLDLWAAKSDSGGVCWFVDYEADVTGDGPPPGYAGCDPAKIPADGISYSTDWGATHPDRMTVLGRVYVDAATVKVTLLDGSTATLPIAEGLFFGTVAPDAQVASLAAYDAAGNEVAQEVVPR